MIILSGVAGAGKSSQGQKLAKDLGYQWVSTGELLRAAITGPHLEVMKTGRLLSDSEMIDVLDHALQQLDTDKLILDGFPRSLKQAEWIQSQVERGRFKIEALVHLMAHEAVVRERLLARGRPDDNEQAIAERFEEYKRTIKPIIAMFRSRGVDVYDINADNDIETVHRDVLAALRP